MSGSIIGGLEVKNAVLLAYDTRVHKNQIVKKEWNRVRHCAVLVDEYSKCRKAEREVEVINKKAHLAGVRSFSVFLHRKLLNHVTRFLTVGSKRQLEATEAAEFLRDTIKQKVEMVSGNETKKSKMQTQVDMCGLILGIWERLGDGTMAPKLKRLHRGEILEDAPFCAQGVNHEYATAVMREGYHPNMTIAEGVALLVKAIQAAFEADKLIILGGYIEVLVVGFRDIYGLPMSRGEQMLDRAFTCYRVKKFRKRGARKPVKAPYKRRRLILHDSDDEL